MIAVAGTDGVAKRLSGAGGRMPTDDGGGIECDDGGLLRL
jgi:hypothetical protein